MENATKALLIAAAVLVAILIISLGLVVYNMASETIENAGDLSQYEVQQHNDKFEKYLGNQTGSNVNAMLKTVLNYNLTRDETTQDAITVKDGTTTPVISETSTSYTKVKTGARYTVTAEKNQSGFIYQLNITPVDGSSGGGSGS